jgi:hypothetical protein
VDVRQQWAQVLAAASAPVQDRESVLRTAVALGVGVAPAAVGCSLTEQVGAGFRTAATANELALALDLVQYDADEGPCLSAAVHGRVERLDPIDPARDYPAFATAAGRHGVRSSLSLPLAAVPHPAALNFYAVAPGAFAATAAVREAELLARAVAAVLRGGATPVRVSDGELADARSRRALLERACAVLAGAGDGDHQAAFALLARRSRDERRSVFDIAAEVVGLGPDSGGEVAS